MKIVMTTEIALSRVVGRQVRSKHMEKKTLTWLEDSKNVPRGGGLQEWLSTEGSSVYLSKDEKRMSKCGNQQIHPKKKKKVHTKVWH